MEQLQTSRTLTRREASERIGCSPEHLSQIAWRGEIPVRFKGRELLFELADVEEYIEREKTKASQRIQRMTPVYG